LIVGRAAINAGFDLRREINRVQSTLNFFIRSAEPPRGAMLMRPEAGWRMKRQTIVGGLIVAAQVLGIAGAAAGPREDGMAAYNRGDYVPAIGLFRPLAQQGNAKAQSVLGMMYHRGQGVARNSARAFIWLSRASASGDVRAKAELHDVSQTMTPQELSQAQEMAKACEASNYRECEF
jgi:Sel1 repeat